MTASPPRDLRASADLIILGQGMTAQVLALACHAEGWSLMMDRPSPPQMAAPEVAPNWGEEMGANVSSNVSANVSEEAAAELLSWQSVLALSPATGQMLAELGVALPPSQDMMSMWLDDHPAPRPAFKIEDQSALAAIYDRRALAAAIYQRFAQVFEKDPPPFIVPAGGVGSAGKTNALAAEGYCQLADGAYVRGQRVLMCARDDGVPSSEYDAEALVCRLRFSQPHRGEARQIFLRGGPLALLPLPDPYQRALIWSLPRRRAQAARAATPEMVRASLMSTLKDYAPLGHLEEIGPRATQKLGYFLADQFSEGQIIRLGDAAHRLHPMAGQGFNLNCRDIAGFIAEARNARYLGLGMCDPELGGRYGRARRADIAPFLALTHGLYHTTRRRQMSGLFSATAGLSKVMPALSTFFIQQAQTGGLASYPRHR